MLHVFISIEMKEHEVKAAKRVDVYLVGLLVQGAFNKDFTVVRGSSHVILTQQRILLKPTMSPLDPVRDWEKDRQCSHA